MFRILTVCCFAIAVSAPMTSAPAEAGSRSYDGGRISSDRVYVPTRRSGPQVRGFRRSVGGYSYTYNDAIISSQDDSIYQDPSLDRQAGPFDSGFFFDSHTAAPGRSESPYP